MTDAVSQPVRPVVAISMGDPSGIGPEIIVKALADRDLRRMAKFRIYGLSASLDAAALAAGITPYWWRVAHDSDAVDVALHHDVLVFDYPELAMPARLPGEAPGPTKAGGVASFKFVEAAIGAAQLPQGNPRRADAIVTAPISKTSWALGGHKNWPGHTELLASRFRAKRTAMLFVGPTLRVALATVHIPLMCVRDELTLGRVLETIELADLACRQMGVVRPRIAVCGLNPHAGESGLFGDDEKRVVAPAIELAQGRGVDACGPFPGDTIFMSALRPVVGGGAGEAAGSKFDCYVAMYHDQGLIPVKLLDRDQAVNVTVGLPTVRTSPAHGTAFDIAGTDRASPSSMRAAIDMAIAMARVRAGVPVRGVKEA